MPLWRPAMGFRPSRVLDVQVNFLEGGLILGISLLNCVADRARASAVLGAFADCCNPFSLHNNNKKVEPVHDLTFEPSGPRGCKLVVFSLLQRAS